MKRLLAFLGCVTVLAGAEAARQKTWEDRSVLQVRDKDGASQWWTSTWRTGDMVRMTAKYQLEGTMLIEDSSKLNWHTIWKKALEEHHKVEIQGAAKSQTLVVLGNGEHGEPLPEGYAVQLLRSYECPMSHRGTSVIGLKKGLAAEKMLREGLASFFEQMNGPEQRQQISNRWDGATRFVSALCGKGLMALGVLDGYGFLAALAPFAEAAARQSMQEFGDFASREAAEFSRANLERLHDSTFRDGGIAAKKGSPFYRVFKSKDVEEVLQLATTFNELFNGRDYYVSATKGEVPFGVQLLKGGEAMACFEKNAKNLRTLPGKMYDVGGTPDDHKASGVFTRETLNVNAKLFDARRRRVGETWTAEGGLLNNFLHPDLKGEFTGRIVMKYVEDMPLTLEEAGASEKSQYQVRHLKMMTDNAGGVSTLRYEEPASEGGFKFDYSSDGRDGQAKKARLDVYVDKESGYIVKIVFEGAAEMEKLPNLSLTSGWKGVGEVSLVVDTEAVPTRILPRK